MQIQDVAGWGGGCAWGVGGWARRLRVADIVKKSHCKESELLVAGPV